MIYESAGVQHQGIVQTNFMFSFQFNLSSGEISVGEVSSSQTFDLQAPASINVVQVPVPDLSLEAVLWEQITISGRPLKWVRVSDESLPHPNHDIIPGQYEGGYKIWEGSIDLADLLLSNSDLHPTSEDSNVLELGCGHGLPGLCALLAGYQGVTFSDFNHDVLSVTWQNVLLNMPDRISSVECWAGDWIELSHHFDSITGSGMTKLYSLILTAETLYNIDVCKKVFYMIRKHLKVGGVALVASKRYYFGVGGGTGELQALVEACPQLSWDLIRTYEDGVSNIREIVKITKTV